MKIELQISEGVKNIAFLLSLSVRKPKNMTPNMPPTSTIDVMKPFS